MSATFNGIVQTASIVQTEHGSFKENEGDIVPSEILSHIFSFLSAQQICKMALVCKRWKEIAHSDLVWKNVFLRVHGELDKADDQTWISRYKERQDEVQNFIQDWNENFIGDRNDPGFRILDCT